MSEWVELADFPGYFVNRNGQVKGKLKGLLTPQESNGYQYVRLSTNNVSNKKYVHRLIAQTFLTNSDNLPEVDHKDWNRSNNCVENLRWIAREGNCQSKRKQINNKSGVKGLYWSNSEDCWIAKRMINHIIYKKRFQDRNDAESYLTEIKDITAE
jgi:hypothetical protein